MKGREYSPKNWAIGVFKELRGFFDVFIKDKLLINWSLIFLLQKMKQKLQQYLILILQKPLNVFDAWYSAWYVFL